MRGNISGHVKTVLICAIPLFFSLAMPLVTLAQDKEISSKTVRPSIAFQNKVVVETEIKDANSAIDYWIRTIAGRLNAELIGKIYENLELLHKDFKNGLIDWAILAPNDYVQFMNDIEAELGPVPLIEGKTKREYFLVVRSDSSISHIGDLKGKRMAWVTENDAGRIYVNTLLMQNKLPEIEDYFDVCIDKRTFSQAILAVFFGQADACITNDKTFKTLGVLNPQIRERLKILAASPAYLHAVSIFKKNIDPKIKSDIENEVYNLNGTVEGKQILMLFRIDGMVPVHEPDLNPTIELMKEYFKLKAKAGLSHSASETKAK